MKIKLFLKKVIPLALLGLMIGFTYRQFPLTFFQQEEMGNFGSIIGWQSTGFANILKELFIAGSAIHFSPLNNFIFFLQFKLFGLNFPPYAYFSLGLHLLNSFLVFHLIFLLFRKKYLGLAASLIFAANSISHQAVSWVGTAINSGGSCLFLLLSLIFSYQFLALQKKKWLYFSLLSLIISLGFKETPAFLFIFLPVFWLILSSSRKIAFFKKPLLSLFSLGFLYLGLRIILLFNNAAFDVGAANYSPPPKIVYLFRSIFVPLRALSQSFFGEKITLGLARDTVGLAYPDFQKQIGTTAYDLFTQTVAADLVSFSLSLLIIFIGFILFRYFRRLKKDNLANSIVLSLIFIALSSLPFAFISGKAGYFSIFEPRHLYLSLIGSSAFITIFLFGLSDWLSKLTKKPLYLYFMLLLIPILVYHIESTRSDLRALFDRAQTRKAILAKIQSAYPDLPQRAIFYVESDTAYYGFPETEKNLPFQIGPGKILLIWYYDQEKYPPCFYNDLFLYKLADSQGYRECQGRGFGYFRDYDKLLATIKEYQLSADNVFAFSFFGKTNELRNVTKEIRSKIEI